MKKFILITSILALMLGLFATEVVIGTGTATQRFPLGSFYGHERSAALYTAAEIGAQNTRISALSWYSSIATTAEVPTKIYLKTTGASTLTTDSWDNMIAGAVMLYDQPFTGLAGNGWNLFTLAGAFDVDQGDNLIILVERNFGGSGASTAGGSSAGGGIHSTSTPGGHLTWNADNNPPTTNGSTATNRPNVTITFTSYTIDTPPNPTMVLSPADGAINMPTNTTLNWGGGGGGPSGYRLFFGTDNPPTNIENNTDLQSVFTYTPAALNRGTTYYWQVVPYNANGSATACPIWSFSTVPEGMAMIGDGSITTLSLPINPYFNFNYSQTLYLQDEIDIAGQRIEKLYYYWNGVVAGTNCKDWTIYMGHTNQSAFDTTSDWVPFGNLVETFSGEVNLPASEGWIEIPLTMPFVYNNTDNLVIAVNEYTAGNAGSSVKFHGTSTSEYRGLRMQRDGVGAFDPENMAAGTRVQGIANIRLQFGALPTEPILTVNPEEWDFGSQYINTTEAKTFTLTNTGSGSLSVSSVGITGTGFTLDEAFTPVTLLSGEGSSFTVNFAPVTGGNHTGNVVINDNRAVTNVPLSGEGFDPTIYTIPWTEGFETDNTNNTPIFGWTQEGIAGTYEWVANNTETNYNRSPRTGDWNANLRYSNTRWMFRPIQLEAGLTYRVTIWARQDGSSPAGASIDIRYGIEPNAAAMTEIILPATTIIDGEYQRLGGNFTPATSGIFYLGILGTKTSANWYISIDDISIEFPEPVAPEPAIAVWPLTGSTTLLNPMLKWSPSSTGEPASSYKVYLNQDGIFTENDLIYEGADMQYQTTDLGHGLSYFWKVLPTNTFGSDPTCPTWSFNTPTDTQIAEGFESTTFPPVGWANGSTGNWTRSTSTPLFEGTASAYKLASTSNVYVLSTPLLDLETSSTFDFYTRASNVSQVLQVVYSQDRDTWTQIGANITYDATGIWYPASIDLGSLAGASYYIGFQTPLQTTSGSIYVDHVVGPEITPLLPGTPVLTAPVDAAINQSILPELTWTAASEGGVPAGYNVYLDTIDGSTLLGTSITTSYTPGTALEWDTTYHWKVAAYNNAGESVASAVRSFTTMADVTVYTLPFTEGFETNNTHDTPVLGWSQEAISGTSTWTANNTLTTYNRSPRTGDWNAFLRYGNTRWMFKPVQLDAGITYRVSAYVRQDGATDTNASVGISYGAQGTAASMTETIVAPTGIINGDYQRLEGSFVPDTAGIYYIGILGTINTSPWYISIDDILIEAMSADPVFVVTPDSHDFGPINIGTSVSQDFTIVNNGGGTLGINEIAIDGNATMVLSDLPALPAALQAGDSVAFTVTYTPIDTTDNAATVTITDDLNTRHVLRSSDLRSAGNRDQHAIQLTGSGVNDITIGDGSETSRVPADFYWKSSLFETIYTADEMGDFIGMIEGLRFYNQFTSTILDTPLKIWLGSTTQTDLSADWIASTLLTQVFDSTVDFPQGENVITITFPEPYMYLENSNLVMMVNRPLDTAYYSSSDNFKTQTVGTNRSRKLQSDTVQYDPANPTGGVVSGIFPKTTFIVDPSSLAQVTGTVLASDTGSGISGASISLAGNQNYTEISGVSGSFTIANVIMDQSYDYTISATGYASASGTITVNTEDFSMGDITLIEIPYAPSFLVAEENAAFTAVDLSWNAPEPSSAPMIHVGTGKTSDRSLSTENFRHSSSPLRDTDRALLGYKVWRFIEGEEANEASWISLTDEAITDLSYEDEGWIDIPVGSYKWAVKAIYTDNVTSDPAISNTLEKIVITGNIVGFVKDKDGQGIADATISAGDDYSATTNPSGAYSLNLPVGIYSVTATAAGYDTLTQADITVLPNQNTTVNFIMLPVSNEDEIVPINLTALSGNYPNPFNPETTISYDLKDAANVRLAVYNVKGQLVRSLVNANQSPGRYRVVFNARDDRGKPLSSGIYLYHFSAGKYSSTRKMMLME